jgi:ribosome biogenesis GTPase / thiamine phosphate phosphatase
MNRPLDPFEIEEEFFDGERKKKKNERKALEFSDRSKFKKTDHDKWISQRKSVEARSEDTDLLRGRVLSINPQEIRVAFEDKIIICQLRGLLKKEKSQEKNLVTVGDFVRFRLISSAEGSIQKVEERKSVLARADNLSRRKQQLIAANIDQVLITLSVVSPPMKPFLADRYVIAADKGGMKPVILINKIDLLDGEEERALLEEMKKGYLAAGIPVIPLSCITGEGMDALKEVMKDKASVFSGQSGVGKSSLINQITGLDLRIGETVDKTNKGSHTTTTAQLIPLSFGGFCIDTPGIRSFGVWDLSRQEVEAYFDEIHELGSGCKFPDCHHLHETKCAVKDAVEAGTLSSVRYLSYLSLLETIDLGHVRR